MNRKLQLLYLIEQYCNGKYDIQTFSSLMTKIYHIERDDSLSEKEKSIFEPLVYQADYFSPYSSDHEMYNGFTTEEEVKAVAFEAYKKLQTLYKTDSFSAVIEESIVKKTQ